MGDGTSGSVRLSFNPPLRVEFHGATVTSDAGLLLPGELDERRAIAHRLGHPVGTVKDHVQKVIRKLGVSDRAQAAVKAVQLGLIQAGSLESTS